MRPNRLALAAAAVLLLSGTALLGACGKKSPTTPGGGGGGGGGGGNTAFDSGLQASAFVFQRTFLTVGTVGYHCTPHRNLGMTGTITISAGDTTSLANVTVAPGGQLVFSPSAVTIKPGGTVKWTWGSGGHTVTSN